MGFFKKDKNGIENASDIFENIKRLEKKIEDLSKELAKFKEENKASLKKVAISRFNPFPGVGGDQSFSLVLLDEKNNGVAMTSLFTQEGNRVYAKPIKSGSSEYILSEEEKNLLSKFLP